MFKNIKHYAVTVGIILLILCINVMAYFQYSSNIGRQLDRQVENHLKAIIDETVECLDIKMEEKLAGFKAVATFIGSADDVNGQEILKALTKQAETAGYSDFDVVTLDGIGLDSKGKVDYSANKNYQKALGGKSVIDVKKDQFGMVDGVEYYVPIYGDGKIVGVLMTSSTLEQFTNYMDISDRGQYGNVFMVKQDGTLLTRGYGLDEVENISMVFDDKKSASELINSMQSRQSGYVEYKTDDSVRYICYSRTAYNKWYMVSIVSASSIELTNDGIENEGTIFFMEIAVLTIILTIYLTRAVVVESRGNIMNKQRYYLVSKYTDKIVFDYSCHKDTMYCNENWKKIFGYDIEKANLRADITRYIADEDKERYTEIVNVFLTEKDFVKFQIGIKDAEGQTIMCNMKMSAIKGKKGKLQKVLGIIEVC
ncbi:MAG: PAS domain-containing protein [Lachnospiraceae bacterium]|nr:PAS domain-containing protein [Lachnospiraceae bacterium]